ncbi:hypothetical protein DFS33DRAFT_237465 [Desarmillaria ectypa]|nr:hypothetical protein DFS33DRAFT_237465 [Desarmillaria ectypa]
MDVTQEVNNRSSLRRHYLLECEYGILTRIAQGVMYAILLDLWRNNAWDNFGACIYTFFPFAITYFGLTRVFHVQLTGRTHLILMAHRAYRHRQ